MNTQLFNHPQYLYHLQVYLDVIKQFELKQFKSVDLSSHRQGLLIRVGICNLHQERVQERDSASPSMVLMGNGNNLNLNSYFHLRIIRVGKYHYTNGENSGIKPVWLFTFIQPELGIGPRSSDAH